MTKSQRLTKDIQAGKVKYLHVSVLVATKGGVVMRTPHGQGATAKKVKTPKQEPIGRQRRRARTNARLALTNKEAA